jgi:hypothetical protein
MLTWNYEEEEFIILFYIHCFSFLHMVMGFISLLDLPWGPPTRSILSLPYCKRT